MITLLFNITYIIITNEGIIYIMILILILIYYLKPNNKPCLLASSYDGILNFIRVTVFLYFFMHMINGFI